MGWDASIRHTWLVVALILAYLGTATGLKCYQCNSTLDHNCQEIFNFNSPTNQFKYKDCDLSNAQFCIKATGLWGGVVGTHRFCSSRDLGDQCQEVWYLDHDRMYRACVYTCTGHGCNTSSHLTASIFIITAAILGALYLAQKH